MDADEIYQRSQQKRRDRFKKDWTIKRLFYQMLDEILKCGTLESLQPGLEYLLGLAEQVDGMEIYNPIQGWEMTKFDVQCFIYGLQHWTAIKAILIEKGSARSVDIIKDLNLEKRTADNFFYIMSNLGVLEKHKEGRYNAYRLVSEAISPNALKAGWPSLFADGVRLPTD